MRYFKTTNASRQYFGPGGLVFTFEPTEQVGGGWHGVLAVEESAASTLATLAKSIPQISEMTLAQYEDAKKKPRQQSSYTESPVQPRAQHPPLAVAQPAAPTAQPASQSSAHIELKTTGDDPPLELVDEVRKPGKRK